MISMMDQWAILTKASVSATTGYGENVIAFSKVIASFYTIKDILRVKQCENDKPIIVTHDSEQEKLLKIVRKYLWSACK